ncbi:MAG: WYL domain-containing transcriptional regulator [Erysipelotrichaceae bacterium]|nr:WYL domain-containing transcriptional regulator [Erysipelotrichaceae bacterium]
MNNKIRLLYLLKYLQEHTNPEHIKNAADIGTDLSFLGKELDRKTIYSDIENLNEAGYEIEMTRNGDKVGYYYDGELFDQAEMRILADSILSSESLSEKKTDQMLEKLLSLTNEYDRKEMKQQLKYRITKTANEQVLYNIDAIQKAISRKQAITFRYFDIDITRKKKYRDHSYTLIPYALVRNMERYYLIAFNEKHDNYNHYRLDKMDSIKLEETEHKFREFDISGYMSSAFGMYSGEKQAVTLRCKKNLAERVMDHFNNNGIITKIEDEWFEIEAEIMVSPVFYSWLFSYNGDIRIIKPESVIEGFKKRCEDFLSVYQKEK